jgi:glyoxylase I family protein
MQIQKIHHVAYRCHDAKETVDFYGTHLNMGFVLAMAEDTVPSTGKYDPYMHVFLDAGQGNVLAFFELPEQPAMGRDQNTPDWVQHIAFQLENTDELLEAHDHLVGMGLHVVGPTDHGIFKSIYFFDPNGHRIELAANTRTLEQMQKLNDVAPAMLEEWSQTKRAPKHAAWLHQNP